MHPAKRGMPILIGERYGLAYPSAKTSRLLGRDALDFDADAGGLEISLEGFPSITVEKVPERDRIAVSGLLSHYPD